MIQTGDPSGSGKGGQSIWGKPFPDEIRSTLKVVACHHVHPFTLALTLETALTVQQPGHLGDGQLWAGHQQIAVLHNVRKTTPSRWQVHDFWQGA